jgi:hypothetical protein
LGAGQTLRHHRDLERPLRQRPMFIEDRVGVTWIPNPTDPTENFADRWAENPMLKEAFFQWLEQVRADFRRIALMTDRREISEALAAHMGIDLVEKSFRRREPATVGIVRQTARRLFERFDVWWREKPSWPERLTGRVAIVRASFTRSGFRPSEFGSGETIPRHADLIFEAKTNVKAPYRVYWQIVNTGTEAEAASARRGGSKKVSSNAEN